MATEPEAVGPPTSAPPPPSPPPADGWKRDKQGREYVTVPGRRGPLYRRGEETIAERLERDQRPKDERPEGGKKKRKPPISPDAPRDVDLRAIEAVLAEALRSPAMFAGLAGDQYLANHFTEWGPRLARNLVATADHNPWLKRQLEGMAAGGAVATNIATLIGLAGGIVCYLAPPIIYIFDLPAPDAARAMFSIPPQRRHREPPAEAAPLAAVA